MKWSWSREILNLLLSLICFFEVAKTNPFCSSMTSYKIQTSEILGGTNSNSQLWPSCHVPPQLTRNIFKYKGKQNGRRNSKQYLNILLFIYSTWISHEQKIYKWCSAFSKLRHMLCKWNKFHLFSLM